MENRLEEILESLTFAVIANNYGASSAECRGERYKAIAAINQLVKDEVIGRDEDPSIYLQISTTAIEACLSRNEMRITQRKIIDGGE